MGPHRSVHNQLEFVIGTNTFLSSCSFEQEVYSEVVGNCHVLPYGLGIRKNPFMSIEAGMSKDLLGSIQFPPPTPGFSGGLTPCCSPAHESTTTVYACMLSHFHRVQLCDPMDCSPPGTSVHGILQERILEWVAMSHSRGSSQPRDRTCVSCSSCIAGRFFTTEPLGKHCHPHPLQNVHLPLNSLSCLNWLKKICYLKPKGP